MDANRLLNSDRGWTEGKCWRSLADGRAGGAVVWGKQGGGEATRAGVPGSFVFGWLAVLALMGAAAGVVAQPPTPSSAVGRELISNGGFEQENLAGWSLWSEGDADGSVRRDGLARDAAGGPHAMCLTVRKPGGGCGAVQDASPGIGVQSGHWYDLRFEARSAPRENNRGYALTVTLLGRDGVTVCARSTIPEVGGDWAGYQLALHAHHAHADARLIITLSEPGTIWLDEVSLRERPSPVKP